MAQKKKATETLEKVTADQLPKDLSSLRPGLGRVVVRSLGIAPYDRTGNVSIYKVHDILTLAARIKIQTLIDAGHEYVIRDRTLTYFMVSQDISVSEAIYDYVKFNPFNLDLVLSEEIVAVGTTSFAINRHLASESNPNIYIHCTIGFVMVDAKTRKPVPVPAAVRKLQGDEHKGKSYTRPQRVSCMTSDPFEYHVTVAYSDMDFNGHTYQGQYVRYIMDCATHASRSGRYRYFTGDVADYRVKAQKILYLGESYASDVLVVKTWESPSSPQNALRFAICKGNNIIFECETIFYKEDMAKL